MANLAYIGSKYSALNAIDQVLGQHFKTDVLKNVTVVDLFSGTGVVGAHMNRKYGCKVKANDTESFAVGIAQSLLQCPYTPELARHIDAMNEVEPCEGPLVTEFADKRMFFTRDNALKLQAARQYADTCSCTELEKSFLVASLISSVDRVANTTAVYASYLKQFKKSAQKPLKIVAIHHSEMIPWKDANCATCMDANKYDFASPDIDPSNTIVFLDPPYVARQYSAYYSPLGIIHSNDTSEIKGVGAISSSGYLSSYSSKRLAHDAFKELVMRMVEAKIRYVFITYGAYGIISDVDMLAILKEAYPHVHHYDIANRKFKSDIEQGAEPVSENWYFCISS